MGNSPAFGRLVPATCRVFTPRALADAMVAALSTSSHASWLEPSVGDGVFFQALAASGVQPRAVTGIDIDPNCRASDKQGKIYKGCDALGWMQATHGKFARIVGNPPFVSLSEVGGDVLSTALQIPLLSPLKTIGLNSNLWAAFVCAAVGVLERGGSLAFVLPAAWDYATYAEDIRRVLPTLFRTFYVVRSASPMFGEIQDGCVVIVGRGFRERHVQSIRLECKNIDQVCTALLGLRKREYVSKDSSRSVDEAPSSSKRLREYADVRIGAVTGDSNYFVLNETQRLEHALPLSAVSPVLSKARHLVGGSIDKFQFELLLRADEPVWLFDPTSGVLRSDAVQRYLRRRVTHEIRKRTKVRARPKWYSTIVPDRCHGFMSGMTSEAPHVAMSAMARLVATNTLYVLSFRYYAKRYEVALGLLGSHVWSQVRSIQRRYPDGLLKLEPSELANLRVTPVSVNCARQRYEEAVAAMCAGEAGGVRAEIDTLLRLQSKGKIV